MAANTGGGGSGSNRKSWRLEGFHVVRRADVRAGEKIIEVMPPSWIERWTRDSTLSSVVRNILHHTSVASMVGAFSRDPATNTKRLREAFLEAIKRRELVLIRPESGSTAGTDTGSSSRSATSTPPQRRKPAEPPPETKKEKTWVEFRLVNEDGKPMRGAKYRLKITDGSYRDGSLDDAGSVRVQNLDPGMCEISFLDYDQKEWKRI